MQAVLALEDGAVFTGEAFGATGESWGEVVFHTGMTGYQEILTDPAYSGQIVVMTYPLIGNYGITPEDISSPKSYVRGFVVREYCERPSNWRISDTLDHFLIETKTIGLAGIDTRALTRHLRDHGTMRGVISTSGGDPQALVERAKNCPPLSGQNLVPAVATKEIYTIPGDGHRVVLVDFGAKRNIIRRLQEERCEVVVVPPNTTAKDILALRPAGVMLADGPGDPADVPYAIAAVRELMGKIPVFGISLGHEILGLAMEAKVYKMKFGHRGANYPVKDLETGHVYITAHNHGFSVDEASLQGSDIYVTHRNLNDGTVEGIKHKHLPLFSLQYHPEALPGPKDAAYVFRQFLDMMDKEAR